MKNAASDLPVCSSTGFRAQIFSKTPVPLSRILILALLASLILASGCSDDDADVTFPTPPQPASKLWMYDVFGNSADDVYACGYMGSMVHFDGENWTEVNMKSSQNIVAIWGEGDGTLYACGGGGSVWRNSGTGWNSMDSGSGNYLVGLGSFNGDIHVSGLEGTLRRLSGNSWDDTKSSMIIRDPNGAPLDTLDRKFDIASLVTVNHYFVGGAYRLPDFDFEESIGTEETDGMVLGLDQDFDLPDSVRFDWQLRPLRADEIAASEWIQCSTSDHEILGNNYLGTSEGWVFNLSLSDDDRLVWAKMYPRITMDPRAGINDMWLDASNNLYMVTHSGQLVFQTHDYQIDDNGIQTGYRVIHQVNSNSLMGLWGADPDNLFMVGLIEKTVFRYRYDFPDSNFEAVSVDTLQFAEKSLTIGDNLDKFGRPLSW